MTPYEAPLDYSADAADAHMLRTPIIAVLITGVLATIACTLVVQTKGFIAGVLGTVVVISFFGIGQYIVARVLKTNPAVAMNISLLTYLIQMLALFGLMMLLKNATFFAPKAFGITVFCCVMVWTFAAVMTLARTKVLYVEPGSGPGQQA
jgi:hypothetical protein